MKANYSNQNPIQAVVSFSTDGKMKPLYLCIDGATLKVVSVREIVEYGSPIFVCQVIDNDMLKEIKVYFNKNENIWFIPLNPYSV